ncbi:hypothetical protein JOS77_09385 [Chromobacterium haemolyticum]|nr:hypothetical protein JOS77_09385 [Chromobacterium haemolyticum]
MISAYRLDSDCADAQLDPLARQWLRHWRRLPQTAYLLGCHALRAGLGWQAGGLLRLPDWAQEFAAVALPPDAAAAQRPALSHGALLLTGYGRLQAWRERLPRPLAQRLPLLFPPEADAAPPQPAADALIDFDLGPTTCPETSPHPARRPPLKACWCAAASCAAPPAPINWSATRGNRRSACCAKPSARPNPCAGKPASRATSKACSPR